MNDNIPDACKYCGIGLTLEDDGADVCEDCIAREKRDADMNDFMSGSDS